MRIVKDATERKNEILDAAEELFAAKGYDATSTGDILERVGIARGTLYYHFQSKEEILDALMHQKMQQGILDGVVPVISSLVEEGNEQGIFHAEYPRETTEMLVLYASIAFDSRLGQTPEQLKNRMAAIIRNTEKFLGVERGSLEKPMARLFQPAF